MTWSRHDRPFDWGVLEGSIRPMSDLGDVAVLALIVGRIPETSGNPRTAAA
jgi:hypothetical protein